VEAHHSGPRGLSQKSSDYSAIVCQLSERPLIRVESGLFIGRYNGERYEIGPAAIGLPRAIQIMTELRRECLRELFSSSRGHRGAPPAAGSQHVV
jgi:hypothetical protein